MQAQSYFITSKRKSGKDLVCFDKASKEKFSLGECDFSGDICPATDRIGYYGGIVFQIVFILSPKCC